MDLKTRIRDIPDFPKKGIVFRDITTLLEDPGAFRESVDALARLLGERPVDKVACIESRGFLFGAPLALRLGCGLVPLRKPGKLPGETIRETYSLEYGTDAIEMHRDAVKEGERVVIVDDLLATGGTAAAAARLVESAGGMVACMLFLVELAFLDGRERLEEWEVLAAVRYDSE
ncbi:MAG: adenine phosphoribosyltransferase [Candidatus Eisenbacteria bacterium]